MLSPKTCLLTVSVHGTCNVFGGTGEFARITGTNLPSGHPGHSAPGLLEAVRGCVSPAGYWLPGDPVHCV